MAKAFDFKKATLLLAGVFVLFAGAFVFSQNAEALVCSQYSFDALGSCTVDSDCGGVNDKCVSGECYEYTGSTTCPSDSATCQDSDTKQTTTYSCKPPEQDGGCQATTTSTDCASGQMCSAGVCTADTQSPNVGQVNQGTATVGTAVTFSASVTDNVSVTECVLVIDGVDQEGTMSGTPGSSITASKSYTFQSVGDGSYGVGVRCKDAANNSASSIRQVTVSAPADTTPPTVGLISPTSVTQGQSTTFSASVSDNVAVTACDFYTSAGNQGSMSINSSQGIASKSFTFNSTTSGVYARCTDGTNSTEGSRVTVTVNPPADDINPVVSANNASSSWFSSRTTTLSASDTGGSGLAQARYSWDSNAMDGSCTSGGTVFTNGIELTVSQGSHRLFLCARDGNSNVGTWDSGANQYRVDSTKPVSNFGASTPAAGSLQTATFTVYPTDSDTGGSNLATCYYAVYSDPSGWTVYNTTRTCGGSLVITVGADQNCRDIGTGKCQVNIYSRDGAGNTSDISLRSYSIDYSALTITPSSKSFGSVNTGESSSQVFAVQNTSSATISGQATIVDSGTSNADLDTVFSCSGCGSYSLSAGQTMNITITFQPTDDVSYGNDLLITASQGREARAALSGTGVSATPQCFAPQNLLCTYNASANTLNLQWNSVVGASSYKMEWARFDKNYGDTTGTTGGTSRIVSGTSGNTFGLTTNTNYKLRAQAETSTGICTVPGALSADILCATGSCSKAPTALVDSYSVGVPT
ncbi:MAG: hypothetical protein HYT50_00340, partial [Candidatus Wildermuthbacteria bacterium]|nr:hypothetical protein [Candidatus Wildermuthbacteria bacterium]